ncbi:undecaprenyldiphospho-muramoylpentapeptide beta-N-acetylglucosaminyltransferase [Pseudomonas plecoglossicida]|jgi:UDP-N-acetylglucosamine--N-acetylmuramyl-(pentapeptide) pyrophosphoryl-undecaprenol N-acetylglucosamine transferase|uniref:UDP-N-acetylglucosamine--N-acetylmuramyl-(pentapeptide) pyrophosphoryl-undecaprenol N-acetylglucosamine transferase n=3 Tax=Pseudomonas TaxID=286 RepID=A0A0P7CU83_PSEPU|nr:MULTISPECIES: undecaprenyldiphospho-muramoylpentapeptide beta-N-acetylglucosaminyltransferase [Pseudomonas]TXI02107.1 MAG: undecaprenyldiphospho-muramoylpentapeptide beta-N-acetylglucosaminyltransferase [Pseudomonas monteilii]GJB83229.1 UDP-N-acetylglucosamine--N-acetylmuramyl-(pentapeptide) pyrophosphoryl-undecaprenol N-acetylglucosamine transferase [Aeromonas caviae]AGA75271.1 undecaprenyldiphospho-muramoylpentapeptide beta-N- acetylglucosaminyltransferase [Pseudomonas putida HB3267]KPM610
MAADGRNVLIMAGGTGGHVFPALACAREFQARGYSVHWLGTPRGIENELVPQAGLPLHLIQVSGLRGKGKLSLLKAPFTLVKAVLQARRIVRELKPVCVVGFGGYVTGPGGVAARLCGVPLVIHEQNARAGTTNRLLLPLAARVCEAFPATFAASDKLRTTGNPVRPELFMDALRAPLAERRARLLVMGGSLGAEPLNKLLPKALSEVPPALRPEVFHQAGKQHAPATAERYREAGVEAQVEPFIKDMAQAYGWADIVVCRAGALTVSELAAAGLPSMLVPLPHAIDDHQTHNAQYLAREGAAFLMPQATTGAAQLAERLNEVLMQPEKLNVMAGTARRLAKPAATSTVVDICLEVAHG